MLQISFYISAREEKSLNTVMQILFNDYCFQPLPIFLMDYFSFYLLNSFSRELSL